MKQNKNGGWLSRLKLWQQLAVGFGLLALLSVIVLGLFLQYELERADARYQQVILEDAAMERLTREMAEFMLQARRAEKDFLLRLEEKYVTRHGEIMQQFEAKMAELLAIEVAGGHADDIVHAKNVKKGMVDYAAAFGQVVAIWRAKGLDQKSGLQGEFREAAHELSKILESYDAMATLFGLSECRRHEGEFVSMLSSNTQAWKRSFTLLTDGIKTSSLTEDLKKSVSELADAYQKGFHAYVAAREQGKEIALDDHIFTGMTGPADRLEAVLRAHFVHEGVRLLLDARKQEKDYLLRGDKKYVANLQKVVANLLTNVKESGVEDEVKAQIGELLGKYEQVFLALVAKDDELATASEVMRQTVHAVEQKLGAYAIETVRETAKAAAAAQADVHEAILYARVAQGVALLLFILVAMLIGRGVMKVVGGEPAELAQTAEQIAMGDLTAEISGPEGSIAAAIAKMQDGLRQTVCTIQLQAGATLPPVSTEFGLAVGRLVTIVAEVRAAAESASTENAELARLIGDEVKAAVEWIVRALAEISIAAQQQAQAAATVSSAAEEGSANTATLASAAEEMTANIQTAGTHLGHVAQMVQAVVAALMELIQLQEAVSEKAKSASKKAAEADAKAGETQAIMTRLGDSAKEIGKVVAVISNIAEQTNMLALNAAIEAAGAGEAGKGFAVVANEVKELARQTSEATRMIGTQVGVIQANTKDASNAVADIRTAVGEVVAANQEIVAAVEQQEAATAGINESMQQVAAASEEVQKAMEELYRAGGEIARTAAELGHGSAELASTATEMAASVEETSTQVTDADRMAADVLAVVAKTISASEGMGGQMQSVLTAANHLGATAQTVHLIIAALQDPASILKNVQAGFRVGEAPFDMEHVKAAHLAWLAKLEGHVTGATPMPNGGDPRQCVLGQWFYAVEGGARFSALPVYRQVENAHNKIHQLAGEIIQLVNEGSIEQATGQLTQFNQLRGELFALLDELYVAAAQSAQPQPRAA